MSRSAHRVTRAIAVATALVMAAPAAATAASKPSVTTGSAVLIKPTTVRLKGVINPNGRKTTYLFNYGKTTLYGTSTPVTVAGTGTKAITVRADVTGLAPNTRYHFRLVARNSQGTTTGADRNFKTLKQPLALLLAAKPNPVQFGEGTVLGGVLTGTGNGGRQIVLQQSAFPHAQGFTAVGNPIVANAQGFFFFTLLRVPVNTQYRVILPSKPSVVSPIVGVGVSPRIKTRVSAKRVFTGARVRFRGTVRPARRGSRVVVQRKRGKTWVLVKSSKSFGGGQTFSRYSLRVKIRKGGRYRVLVDSADGQYSPGVGHSKRIRRRF